MIVVISIVNEKMNTVTLELLSAYERDLVREQQGFSVDHALCDLKIEKHRQLCQNLN